MSPSLVCVCNLRVSQVSNSSPHLFCHVKDTWEVIASKVGRHVCLQERLLGSVCSALVNGKKENRSDLWPCLHLYMSRWRIQLSQTISWNEMSLYEKWHPLIPKTSVPKNACAAFKVLPVAGLGLTETDWIIELYRLRGASVCTAWKLSFHQMDDSFNASSGKMQFLCCA